MKKSLLISTVMLVVIACVFISCTTKMSPGQLPPEWWEASRSEIQSYYEKTSSGVYGETVIFTGKSSSSLNLTESIALENARLDASIQLSRYLAQKVTGVLQSSVYEQQIQNAVDEGKLFGKQGLEMQAEIQKAFSNFNAMVTNTQFSSFRLEGEHVEKDGNMYTAYVCYTMPNSILQETRLLQQAAFQELMEEIGEYKEVMQQIQAAITQKLEQSIMSGIDG